MRITLVLLDADDVFGEMLAVYIRSTDYADRFSLRVFTTAESCIRYVQETDEQLILLAHESHLPSLENVSQLNARCVIAIVDSTRTATHSDYPVLCKYQPLNQMITKISSYYNDYCADHRRLTGNKRTRISAMFSAAGGCGKTVTAVHLARQLTLQGERVFLLNLETLPSRAWFPDAGQEEDAFSRILYYAKANPNQLSTEMLKWKREHPYWKYDYIPPSRHSQEIAEISGTDVRNLLNALCESGHYDWIVMDLDSSLHPVTLEALEAADHVFWLVLDDVIHLQKTEELMTRLKKDGQNQVHWTDKIVFIQNKSTGKAINDFQHFGLSVVHKLPYVPEWKSVSNVEQMMSSDFAAFAVKSLIHKGGNGGEKVVVR